MLSGRAGDLISQISEILRSVLPDDAVAVALIGETDVNYASASLELRGPDGRVFHFGWDDNPDDAIDEIVELLFELRAVPTGDGREPWYGCHILVRRDGTFDVDFSYDPPED